MKEAEIYLEIAQRYIESCKKHVSNEIYIQEVLGFKSYHAFESIGGAYNSHFGHQVPKGHPAKLNAFVANSKNDQKVNYTAIASLAMILNSMRNKYLYPELIGTNFKCPKDQISLTQAKDLIKKIEGIIKQVDKLI